MVSREKFLMNPGDGKGHYYKEKIYFQRKDSTVGNNSREASPSINYTFWIWSIFVPFFLLFSVIFKHILMLFFVCFCLFCFVFLLVVFCRPSHVTYSESKLSQVSSLVWARVLKRAHRGFLISCKIFSLWFVFLFFIKLHKTISLYQWKYDSCERFPIIVTTKSAKYSSESFFVISSSVLSSTPS